MEILDTAETSLSRCEPNRVFDYREISPASVSLTPLRNHEIHSSSTSLTVLLEESLACGTGRIKVTMPTHYRNVFEADISLASVEPLTQSSVNLARMSFLLPYFVSCAYRTISVRARTYLRHCALWNFARCIQGEVYGNLRPLRKRK